MKKTLLFDLVFIVLIGFIVAACGGDEGDINYYNDPPSQEIDTDGDGLTDDDELQVHKTSPILTDTDGDGMSDFTECVDYGHDPTNNRYRYNPLIADLPELEFNLTSPPSISLRHTISETESRTFETGRSAESARSVNQSQTNSMSSSIEISLKTTVSAEVSFPKGASASVSQEFGSSFGFERSSSYSRGQSMENRRSLSSSEAFENSNEIASSGGILMVTAEIENRGNIAFKIENFILGAVVPDFMNPGVFNPVGNLILEAGNYTSFPNMSLGPGEKLEVLNFINDDLDLTTAKNLLWDSSSLILKPTSIELTGADGTPFSFNHEEVLAKTASIYIDYGGHRRTELYRVATNADPNNWGLTIGTIMTEILNIPFEAGETSWDGQIKQGLSSVRDVVNDETKNAYWVIIHSWDDGLETDVAGYNLATEDYDFSSIFLMAGHKLVLVYIEDVDGDGIYSREEFLRGIIDTNVDCDGDGDAETIGDSDCDGLLDADEIIANQASPFVTDPRMPDTDGDGLNDSDDPNPVVKNYFEIAVGAKHNVVIKTDGTLWVWGSNSSGQLGLADNVNRNEPVQLETADDWIKVTAGDDHTLAIKLNAINSERTLWAWGNNSYGQLGLADNVNRNEPEQVGGDYDWQQIWAGRYHSIALKKNRALWSWGLNDMGQIGIGGSTNENRNTQQLIGSDRWQLVSGGGEHTLGIRADGSLWAWGSNGSGQLGIGDASTNNENAPVQVGEDTDWATVSAGYDYSLAIKTDGTLYVWGANSSGQLGIGTFSSINQLIPKAIGTGWRDISAAPYDGMYTLGIKTNGTLWAWGYNWYSRLGLGDDWNDKNVPVQVGTDNDWVKVIAGSEHSIAVKDDGRIFGWGHNLENQLGLGQGADEVISIPTCIMSIIEGKDCQ